MFLSQEFVFFATTEGWRHPEGATIRAEVESRKDSKVPELWSEEENFEVFQLRNVWAVCFRLSVFTAEG